MHPGLSTPFRVGHVWSVSGRLRRRSFRPRTADSQRSYVSPADPRGRNPWPKGPACARRGPHFSRHDPQVGPIRPDATPPDGAGRSPPGRVRPYPRNAGLAEMARHLADVRINPAEPNPRRAAPTACLRRRPRFRSRAPSLVNVSLRSGRRPGGVINRTQEFVASTLSHTRKHSENIGWRLQYKIMRHMNFSVYKFS